MEENENKDETEVKKENYDIAEEGKEKNKKEKKLSKIIIISIIITIIVIINLLFWVSYYEAAPTVTRAKPIIYIYPEQEQEVEVKLLDKDLLTCSYPKYKSGWNVIANPNGDLVDLDTGNKLYSLYYESNSKEECKVEKEGFCIKKEDIVSFLEEKLEILGLNYKEKEEFIVYWLPKLEKYNYVYIRFESSEEIENNMGLEINPKPETLIRIMMTWRGLDEPIKVEEQQLEKVKRTGYTVVEWGGTQI